MFVALFEGGGVPADELDGAFLGVFADVGVVLVDDVGVGTEDGDGDGFGDVVVDAEGDEAVAEAVEAVDGDGPGAVVDLD